VQKTEDRSLEVSFFFAAPALPHIFAVDVFQSTLRARCFAKRTRDDESLSMSDSQDICHLVLL